MICTRYAFLIQEPQHLQGEFGTVGHIPVGGEDVGVFYVGNLREIFAATANLEGVFPIHLEVALRLAVFHGMRLREAAYGKGLAQGADVHLRGSQRIENVGILQINLVGLGEFAYLLFVGIQQAHTLASPKYLRYSTTVSRPISRAAAILLAFSTKGTSLQIRAMSA